MLHYAVASSFRVHGGSSRSGSERSFDSPKQCNIGSSLCLFVMQARVGFGGEPAPARPGPQLRELIPTMRLSLENDRSRQSKLQQGSCRRLD